MERGPLDKQAGNTRPPAGRTSWGPHRVIIASIVLVAAGSVVLSRMSHDPDCTEGPCAQDVPLILGALVEVILVVGFLVATVVLASRDNRSGKRRSTHVPPE